MTCIGATATTAPRPASPHARGTGPAVFRWVQAHALFIVLAALTASGAALRLAAAGGDLWLDEIWSLHLVAPLTSPDQVFWAISHDNNHFLNSLWMYAVGQNASPLAYRMPSILFGTASILAAAHVGSRVNPAAACTAALLVAVSYACVNYGSEARGYGALILALLLALDLTLSLLEPATSDDSATLRCKPGSGRRWALGASVALGACAHLTMMVGAAVLGLSLLWLLRRGRSPLQAFDTVIGVFRPAMLLLLPLAVAIAAGVALQGGFTLGGASPFIWQHFAAGYGGLVSVLLGLPDGVPAWAALAVAATLVTFFVTFGLLGSQTRVLLAVSLVVIPLAIAIARPSNVEFPRYFLASGLFLVIAIAEAAGRAWVRGRAFRWGVLGLVGAICLGQFPRLIELVRDHRGSPAAVVRLMSAGGPATFAGGRPTALVVGYYASRLGVPVMPATNPPDCSAVPSWMIYDSSHGDALPDRPEIADGACHARYSKAAFFPTALWSGRAWTLYRHAP